jgi:hypothetical protein
MAWMDYMPFFTPDIGNIATIVRWVDSYIPNGVLMSFTKTETTDATGSNGKPCKQIAYIGDGRLNYTNGDLLYSITFQSAEQTTPATWNDAGTFTDSGLIKYVRKEKQTMIPAETPFKNEQELREEIKKIFVDMPHKTSLFNSPLHLWTRIAELTHIAEGLVKDTHSLRLLGAARAGTPSGACMAGMPSGACMAGTPSGAAGMADGDHVK